MTIRREPLPLVRRASNAGWQICNLLRLLRPTGGELATEKSAETRGRNKRSPDAALRDLHSPPSDVCGGKRQRCEPAGSNHLTLAGEILLQFAQPDLRGTEARRRGAPGRE